jgi:hypothetical protein
MSRATSDDPAIAETLDRTRRIESRLTSLINKLGFISPGRKPIWNGEDLSVTLQSKETALDDILGVIPAHVTDDVAIVFAGKVLCVLSL